MTTIEGALKGRIAEVSPLQGLMEGNSMDTLHFVQGHEWFGSFGAN
jgi:hypothetical protein